MSIVKVDKRQEIAQKLLKGESVQDICRGLKCDDFEVLRVLAAPSFVALIDDQFRRESKLNGLLALRDVKQIADDRDNSTTATRLKASIWLADNYKEINDLHSDGEEVETMTQDQLAKRLQELQKEAIKRAKPIDTGVNTSVSADAVTKNPSIDDMM